MSETVRTHHRVRASELVGRNWLNTGGKSLDLEALRGKIVLLDFWTFCCINCLHVLDELRPLEEKYSDVLVTVGVHSPKFEHEADPVALAAAVERYEIHHPVLDDPELDTWKAYTARAWPTLVVIDPEGYIVAHLSGEGHADGLGVLISELVEQHEAKGTLHRGSGPYVAPEPTSGTLRFPGKALYLPAGRGTVGEATSNDAGSWLVTDTGHHRLVELHTDFHTVLATFGTGVKGYADGGSVGEGASAQFNEPQGLVLLPEEVAAKVGYDVVIADSVNHRLRGLSLAEGKVTTLVGNGVQRLLETGPARVDEEAAGFTGQLSEHPLEVSLSSPWDVIWSSKLNAVVVAMAGTHQIFSFDPLTGAVAIAAGNGLEGLLDGPAHEAWFAQSSGLAEDADGNIWVADSETSSLRKLVIDDAGTLTVETAVGKGLFDFGFRDGDAAEARLQHPLGVTVLPDGSVAIADTYNGAVRRYDPATKTVSTLARGLSEPSDVIVDHTKVAGAEPLLVVVEANKHQLIYVPIPKEAQQVDEGASQTHRPKSPVAPGLLELNVRFTAPTGQKLDDRWGDPTQLKISSTPPELLVAGGGTSVGLNRTLELSADVPDGVLHITARAAACDGPETEDGEIPDHAACHLYQQDWGIPVLMTADGDTELVLDLRGMD
ncbi:NHL domain-containing thioredoxin family protein [Pseudarthrobacter sp. J75]|uniref:NHL domain-containing thioredoxin family protein n=1 Tax=unclassified Pseudarthrobacter TaxID=2647000 RepID=UPI002E7FE204|nr:MULTISPECIES: NHL domain-containing thioredoxin family protein [unclassified Pseudarthrobacter]MEE2524270.1 NHL domain-containing thioredoxin family protein [Pseudarthrobacter sp. J47]MEE2530134.1 NHL domain-containing thioredoxin family protein [Pseudarthrobacter sp. J75]